MSKIKELIKENGETEMGSWTLNLIPINQKAQRFLGKLHVTDKHIYFDAQFDTSISGTLNSLIASVGSATGNALLVSKQILDQWKDKGFLCISKSEIKAISEKKTFLKKSVNIKLLDDSEYIFDYGMLSVTKIVDALKK